MNSSGQLEMATAECLATINRMLAIARAKEYVRNNESFADVDLADGNPCRYADAYFELRRTAMDQDMETITSLVTMVMSVLGIFGFVVALIVFYCIKSEYASPSYVYHKAIAWIELTYLLINIVYRLEKITEYYPPLEDSLNAPRISLARASDLCTVCITVDRFIAIYYAQRWRQFNQWPIALGLTVAAVATALSTVVAQTVITHAHGAAAADTADMGYKSVVCVVTLSLTLSVLVGFTRLSNAKKKRATLQRRRASAMVTSTKITIENGTVNNLVSLSSSAVKCAPGEKPSMSTVQNNGAADALARSAKGAKQEWRNLTNLCYLLLALVIPYFINFSVDALRAFCYHMVITSKRDMAEGQGKVTMQAMYHQMKWVLRTMRLIYILDMTNDVYHACNFYMYVLFSSKWRDSLRKLFITSHSQHGSQTMTRGVRRGMTEGALLINKSSMVVNDGGNEPETQQKHRQSVV